MSSQSRLALPALLLATAMAVVVGTALGFEHIGGYIPCKLCLEQRVPYYAGVPIALLAALAAAFKSPPAVSRGLLAVAGLAMAYALYLGVYHSGVEWSWWAGPADCGAGGAGAATTTGNLLDQLNKIHIVSCTDAPFRFPDAAWGLSFAGLNAVASTVLALAALFGIARDSGRI